MVEIIAHRGGSGLRVENTLAAFANAIATGAAGAELDVRFSADGQVVVHHDSHLNSGYCRHADGRWLTAGEEPAIADLDYEVLRGFDIGTPRPGSDYARRFDAIRAEKRQRIPLLQDVIRLVREMSDTFFLVMEVKDSVLDGKPEEWRRLVDTVLEIVEREGLADRFRLCSFDWRSLLYARQQREATRTWFTTHPLSWYGQGIPQLEDIPPDSDYLERFRAAYRNGAVWLLGANPADCAAAIAAAGGEAWFMYHTDCSQARVLDARWHGLSTAAWSVNLRDQASISALQRAGVDWSCVDYPG